MPNLTKKRPRSAPRLVAIDDPGHLGFDYQIRYSGRNTVSVQVRNGAVRLAAPHHACPRDLQQWLTSKATWVRDKLASQQQRQEEIPRRRYHHGELVPLLGRSIRLHIATADPGRQAPAELRGDDLYMHLQSRRNRAPEEHTRALLEEWYKTQAQEFLEHKTRLVCDRLGVQAAAVRLRRTVSKWGHCTPAGVIQYNWLIMQAPEAVVDYLVTHECCHLVHLNHSRQYWALVHKMLPTFRSQQRWLKDNGHTLVL